MFAFITMGWLVVGGILAASSLIVAKRPDAQQLIDKLTPYQGWIGIVLFVYGIYDITNSLGYISVSFIGGLIWLIAGVVEIVLGFLLGFGLITQYVLSKNEQAMEKGQQLRAKLAPFQGILGIIAIITGVVFAVTWFIF
jgi:hypothetical protein